MEVQLLDFFGDYNLGIFAKASDRICIVGNFISEKTIKKIEKILEVKVIKSTISNTDLIGIFCSLNSNGIVLPKILTNRELGELKKTIKEHDLNLKILESKFTAIGNLVLCNDQGTIISRLLSKKDKKVIEDCLDVPAEYSTIAGMNVVGSCGVATNKGCLLHRDTKEDEIEKIKQVLKVDVDIGTANFGSPFVGSCMIANSNGCIVGKSTTGPELVRITEALGFTRI